MKDKVVLITGGTSGIGLAAARKFRERGARVCICGTSREKGAALPEFVFYPVDVRDADAVARMVSDIVKRFDALDIAFNNAGIGCDVAPVGALPEADWLDVVDVNLNGTFRCMKYELAQMTAQGGGVIVNNASIAGIVGFPEAASPYVASKAGIIGLTKTAALEYAARGIRVNSISPGMIDTRMTALNREALRAMTPLGRLGRAEEAAAAAVWLCSDAAAFVTGQNLVLDGGFTAK